MKEVSIILSQVTLNGFLTIPPKAEKIIIFAHGSGSGRNSPRNQFVASVLVKDNLATLLLDLLTPEEEAVDDYTREFRFNILLLSKRLIETSRWLAKNPLTSSLKRGYFGASTGSAAALIAAAEEKEIFAVVSRGGRPDLAELALPKVKAPTLLIVGGDDFEVIELNQKAFDLLKTEKKLEIVPGATHLFEEKGALEAVATLAAKWFKNH